LISQICAANFFNLQGRFRESARGNFVDFCRPPSWANLRRRIWSTDLTDFGNLVRQVWLLISSISSGPGSSVEAAAFAH
jgi:hypothetical protein